MRALVFSKTNTELVLKPNYPKPERGNDEALVKVVRAGVCNTDLEIVKGYMGFEGILGHEFIGRIEDIDSNDKGLKVGQRVVGEINLACRSCKVCQGGGIARRNHCPKRTVLGILQKNGTFADYLTLPVTNLFPVPDDISDAAAVFVEPLAAAFRPIEQGLMKPTDQIAVVGDGKLGLLIAEAIYTEYPNSLTVFGHHAVKMELLPKKINKIVVGKEVPKEFVEHFDVVVEATGQPSGLMMSVNMVHPLGIIALKTTCSGGDEGFNTAPFVIKEIQVIGSRCGNFETALKALEDKKIDVEKYLDKVYSCSDAIEAFNHAGRSGTKKIQVSFE